MAHLYGKQSEYLISSENKSRQIVIRYAIIGFLLFIALIIYALVYRIGFLRFAILLWIFDIVAILLLLPRMRYYRMRRNRFHDGRRSEGRAWYLLKELPDAFYVFQDIKEINGLWGNIDFMIVGPTGIYTVEVKSHKGVIRFDGVKLTRDRWIFREKDFMRQAKEQSRAINNFIRTKVGEHLWIIPLIVFASAQAYVHVGHEEVSGVRVIHGDDLVKFIQAQPITLSDDEVRGIIGIFCDSGLCKK